MTIAPQPMPAPSPMAGPVCRLCGERAVVHWQRRLTEAEFAAHLTLEHAAVQAEYTTVVFACAAHAITLDAAARVHQATCTAPSARDLPGCDCTPEPAPPPDPEPTAADVAAVLPPGWSW
ncbi:hypothetical protein [Streptomyces sp. NPDC001404]|uniref:hypothetical protein n=1 Tax=Streptomyces sp. NPDC001404 TaxID=3364571 RepID=UPI0036892C91